MNAIVSIPEEERQALNALAQRFARKELAASVLAHEYPGTGDLQGLLRTATDAGLLGINLPLEYGGSGLDATALAGVLRELAAVDAGIAGILFTHAAALEIIAAATHGDSAHADDIYARIAVPQATPLAFAAATAPEEAVHLTVHGDGTPHLSGRVPFLMLGGLARHAIVAGARLPGGACAHYLVDLGDAGVTRSDPVPTLGLQACRTVDAEFRDVPATRLGAEGDGTRQFRAMQARLAVAAAGMSLGLMEGSFATARRYAGERHQGGRLLVDWSGLRMKLADMAIRIDVANACLDGLAASATSPAAGRAALAAAIHLGELACEVTSEGIQLLGGNGYMKDFGQEKRLRDARQVRTLLGMNGLKKLNVIESLITENQP